MSKRTVAVVSGGMDSITLVHHLMDLDYEVALISFDYGQRHRKELSFAQDCAETYNLSHEIVDLSNMIDIISRSALTNTAMEVPDGHYAEQTMRITVVPNRNAIMLNIAAGYAVTIGAQSIATGVHGGDHYIYPDCRPAFISSLETMLKIANEGFIDPEFEILTPFLHKTKTDIAIRGHDLDVPWLKTWSCYKGGEIHCGACGTCFERREAFEEAGIADPTEYQSTPSYVDPR